MPSLGRPLMSGARVGQNIGGIVGGFGQAFIPNPARNAYYEEELLKQQALMPEQNAVARPAPIFDPVAETQMEMLQGGDPEEASRRYLINSLQY